MEGVGREKGGKDKEGKKEKKFGIEGHRGRQCGEEGGKAEGLWRRCWEEGWRQVGWRRG